MHTNLLCACWHSEAVRGSSSLSSRRLLISLWFTSSLFLCPELTDAPCPYYEGPVPPSPRWRPHSQGPHTLPFQGTRQKQTHLALPLHWADPLQVRNGAICMIWQEIQVRGGVRQARGPGQGLGMTVSFYCLI
jgi:hypothetical protein